MIKKNSVYIENNTVRKKKNDRVIELYDYLDSVDFNNYPKIVDMDEEYMSSEYINETKKHEITKGIELIKTVANLHKKTSKLKDVSKNKYRKIYEKILGNIEYLNNYYEEIISNIEDTEFMSPSNYLFARNYSLLDSALKYSSDNIKKWFKLVENKNQERVCVIHNNLSLKHHIKGEQNYLISFDNYLVDTPVLDLYKFYKKDGFKLNFNMLLKEYNNIFELSMEEKMMLNSLISIPPKIEFLNDEYLNCINIQDFYNYIRKGILIVNENK